MIDAERIQQIEARLAAATPGPLELGIVDHEREPGEWFRENLSYGTDSDVWVVWCPKHPLTVGEAPKPEHAVLTAITGNGPQSEANAELYANAPSDLRYLLTRLAAAEERAAYVICDRCDNGYLPTGETETGAFGETVEVERVCEACHGLGVQLAPWLATRLQRRLNALKAAEERADRAERIVRAATAWNRAKAAYLIAANSDTIDGGWQKAADALEDAERKLAAALAKPTTD
jgi:hypothetical protein